MVEVCKKIMTENQAKARTTSLKDAATLILAKLADTPDEWGKECLDAAQELASVREALSVLPSGEEKDSLESLFQQLQDKAKSLSNSAEAFAAWMDSQWTEEESHELKECEDFAGWKLEVEVFSYLSQLTPGKLICKKAL